LPEEFNWTWGGPNVIFYRLYNSGVKALDISSSFCIHKFHGIKTANRANDREDPRKILNGLRY
jgi:hypothetical protein